MNHQIFMDNIKIFAKNESRAKTLIQTIKIYRKDIGMKFGIEKCAMLIIKNLHYVETMMKWVIAS